MGRRPVQVSDKKTIFHNYAQDIMLTCPWKVDILTFQFYIVKIGFTGVYIIFLFSLQNIDCGYSLEPPH